MKNVPHVSSVASKNNLKWEKSLNHKGISINIFEEAPIGGSPPCLESTISDF